MLFDHLKPSVPNLKSLPFFNGAISMIQTKPRIHSKDSISKNVPSLGEVLAEEFYIYKL
jgi:hypothetical protein